MASKHREQLIAAVIKEWARLGGQERSRKLSKARRVAIAKKASRAAARWRKAKKQKPAA